VSIDLTDETRHKGLSYEEVLEETHSELHPRTYVEIGVATGTTLRLAPGSTDVLGIDPLPRVATRRSNTAFLRNMSEDAFKSGAVDRWLQGRAIDLAFIDGLHEFETALHDFFEVEKRCAPDSIVLFHDCLPESSEWTVRSGPSEPWTGDVWKVVVALLRFRPDLSIRVLDAAPSGLAAISQLNPANTTWSDNLTEALASIGNLGWTEFLAERDTWPICSSEGGPVPGMRDAPFAIPPHHILTGTVIASGIEPVAVPVPAPTDDDAASKGTFCCIYRARNVDRVIRLVKDALHSGLSPRLWALDDVVPELASWTVGNGPGLRSALLNRLAPTSEQAPGWLLFADDDVIIIDGSLSEFLMTAQKAGLQLAQPGHHRLSHASHGFTRSLANVIARRTSFVEIGPIVAIASDVRPVLLPLDESLGMGWGQDLYWSRAIAGGEVVGGIVDQVQVIHLERSGHAYDTPAAARTLEKILDEIGVDSVLAPQSTLATWLPGQPAPAWN
jgi:hypothetical protein